MQDHDDLEKNELLGEILLRRKLVTAEQLKKALEVQQKEGGYIGETLVRLGYIDEKDVVAALIVQCNFPYIAVDKYEIERSILQLVPKETATKYLLVPLDRVGDVLSIVMVNPLDKAVRAELHRLTQYRIAPFIATRAEIEKAINRWYV